MIDTVLFDIDGTLLPMDIDEFENIYYRELIGRIVRLGYDKQQVVPALKASVKAMVVNDGSRTNEQAFWSVFEQEMGPLPQGMEDHILEFYTQEFGKTQAACKPDPAAAQVVQRCKDAGLRMGIASNPMLPQIGMERRLQWAGIDPAVFDFITSYVNCSYSKSNPLYFDEIARTYDVQPATCLMVGDGANDMAARQCGMQVFLLTSPDCPPAPELADVPHGGFDELWEYIASQLA